MKYDSTKHKINKSWVEINKALEKTKANENISKEIALANKSSKDILILIDRVTTVYGVATVFLSQLSSTWTYYQLNYPTDWVARAWSTWNTW